MKRMRWMLVALGALMMPAMLSGCFVVGYSSASGGFIWPGGLGLVVMLLVIWFIFGRRR